jgi:hypothetical protein
MEESKVIKNIITVMISLALVSSFLGYAAGQKMTGTPNGGDTMTDVTVDDLGFIAGRWEAEAFGGICEEVWNPPSGGSMVGMFKLVKDHAPVFYEIFIIAEDSAGLALKLKHFNPDLTGWEEKNDMVTFPFARLEDNKAVFDGLTFHRTAADTMLVTLTTEHDGKVEEIEFLYHLIEE